MIGVHNRLLFMAIRNYFLGTLLSKNLRYIRDQQLSRSNRCIELEYQLMIMGLLVAFILKQSIAGSALDTTGKTTLLSIARYIK